MSDFKSVPREFVDDFEAVATRYNLRELGQYDEAKAAARKDLDNAITTFSHIAKETQ